MAFLAVFQPDARVGARLSGALGTRHEVSVCRSWQELREILEGETVNGCVVDADHPDRGTAIREIAAVRQAHPSLAIVAYADASGRQDYYDLGGVGADGLVLAGDPDPAVRTAVERALAAASAAEIAQRLSEHLRPEGARAMAWAVEHARDQPSVTQLAAGLGHTPSSLARFLRDEGLPPPSRLLLWGRLLLAGALLGRDGLTVEETAYSLGYSAAAALGRAMKAHTGLTPRDVAGSGGVDAVLEALLGKRRFGSGSGGLKALVVAGLAFTQIACAGLGLGTGGVDRDAIDEVLDSPPMGQIHFGVHAIDASSRRTLYTRNAHRKFVPASNQKILVTAAALSLLGSDYRYRTEVWATGASHGSTLDGDLVVVATGDPSMSDRFWNSGEAALEALADTLFRRGLRHVTGSVFVDVSAWDSASVGPTWEVEDLGFRYGSTGGAFAIDEGEIEVVVEAGPAVGAPARFSWAPLGTEDFVTSRVVTSPPDSSTRVRPSYLPESRRLVLEGHAELGAVDTVSFAIRDPVRQATAALGRALRARGIVIEGTAQVAWTDSVRVGRGCVSGRVPECPNAGRIFVQESPPLSELVAQILERSQNWMTEQLVRTLGAELGESGSWPDGIDVVRGFLVDSVGIDSLDVAPRDGSGLSAYNLVTPRALVRLLEHMRAGPHAATFRAAMASPGEEDSTLEERLQDLEGRVFAKTGTISNVNSLSGYLVRDDGREVIFSVLSNGSGLPARMVRAAIDDVVRELAR